jgi:hypothetical protein
MQKAADRSQEANFFGNFKNTALRDAVAGPSCQSRARRARSPIVAEQIIAAVARLANEISPIIQSGFMLRLRDTGRLR